MEALDRAVATAYVKKFPEEAKRIHMGKNDEVIEAESEFGGVCAKKPKVAASATVPKPKKKRPAPKKAPATPAKKVVATPAKKVVATPKRKVLPKKKPAKAKPASAPAHKVGPKSKTAAGPKSKTKAVANGGTKSYVTPSLMGMKKKKAAPAAKVSAKLFKGKKRPAPSSAATVDSDESDIEIVADIQPPAAKKKKIGPKSRTR
jgi:hypothetical protein